MNDLVQTAQPRFVQQPVEPVELLAAELALGKQAFDNAELCRHRVQPYKGTGADDAKHRKLMGLIAKYMTGKSLPERRGAALPDPPRTAIVVVTGRKQYRDARPIPPFKLLEQGEPGLCLVSISALV